MKPQNDVSLNQRAFFIAVLVAPAISMALPLSSEWPAHPGFALTLVLVAVFFGFVGTALFLGPAFSFVSKRRGSWRAYILAGGAAALVHSVVGILWGYFLYSPAMLLFGFAFESIFSEKGLGAYIYCFGAKIVGGCIAGGFYGVLSRRSRHAAIEAVT